MKSKIGHMYDKASRAALFMLCMVLLFSCVKVELCAEGEHRHVGKVKIIYHWPEGIDDKRPDSMLVLVNRIVNTQRIGYVSGTETSIGGHYRFGKEYHNDEANAIGSQDEHPLMVSAGEYQVFAFNANSAGYQFENLGEYGNDPHRAVDIHDLGISYVGYELTDPQLNLYGKDWVDFNPYTEYISTNIKPIYRAASKYDEETQRNTFHVRSEEEVEIHLHPQKITQDITFDFPIYTEADAQVVVDSVIAEISGIPRKMYVYTGLVVIDTTYKMLFKMGIDRDDIENVILKDVEKPVKRLDCMSTISVIGLLSNEEPTYAMGAGILQLCIYSHTTNAAGKVKSKTLYAKINLNNTIRNAHLLITDPQGRGVIQNPGIYDDLPFSDTLRIEDSHLVITKDLILETYGDANSLDTWIKGEDGERDDRLDIEI